MNYIFRCPKCNKEKDLVCSMTEYDELKLKQYCDCGTKMDRVFEPMSGTIKLSSGMYGIDSKGGWNR